MQISDKSLTDNNRPLCDVESKGESRRRYETWKDFIDDDDGREEAEASSIGSAKRALNCQKTVQTLDVNDNEISRSLGRKTNSWTHIVPKTKRKVEETMSRCGCFK